MLTLVLLSVAAWLVAVFVYQLDLAPWYAAAVGWLGGHSGMVLAAGLVLALSLVVLSYLLREVGWYSLMFMVDKAFCGLGQVMVCLLSVAAVLVWFTMGEQLWADLGAVGLVPFAVLAGGAFSLQLFDFNYPIRRLLTTNLLLAGLSILVVWVGRLLA